MVTKIKITALALVVLSCTGCAALLPDAVPIEVAHVSHASQHFTAHPTNYGYDTLYTGLKWKRGNFSIKVEEGYTKEHLDGMHEVTEASLEYDIPLHH